MLVEVEVLVEVVEVEVVEVEVVVVAQAITADTELIQSPTDVMVTSVAKSSTVTTYPPNNAVLSAVDGVTEPVFAVRLKLGPKLTPNPLPNVIFISLGILIFYFNFNKLLHY